MDELCRELEALLRSEGANLVGFANLTDLSVSDLPYGIAVAIVLPKEIVRSIEDGPNLQYYQTYHEINERLDHIVTAGSAFAKAIHRGLHEQPWMADPCLIALDEALAKLVSCNKTHRRSLLDSAVCCSLPNRS